MLSFFSAGALLLALAGPPKAPREPTPPLPAAIRRALPAGYTVLGAAQGDLNRDTTPDWLVVLHRPDEQKTSDVIDHPTKRPLLVFVGGAGGTYTLAARSDNAVYCVDCGGMMVTRSRAWPSRKATLRWSTMVAAPSAGRAS